MITMLGISHDTSSDQYVLTAVYDDGSEKIITSSYPSYDRADDGAQQFIQDIELPVSTKIMNWCNDDDEAKATP